MNHKDLKWTCAEAALPLISDGMTVGLGGGTTIHHLIELLSESSIYQHLYIVTPSFSTRTFCLEKGLTVLNLQDVSHLDRAFDGCDQVDSHFQALKSGGAIHTKEKLVAAMADDYILLVDQTKFVPDLTFTVPVTLEVLPDALNYVTRSVERLGARVAPRLSAAKDGPTISDYGNYILDAQFTSPQNAVLLDRQLQQIRGIIDTSLFVDYATKILVTNADGSKLLEKSVTKRDVTADDRI